MLEGSCRYIRRRFGGQALARLRGPGPIYVVGTGRGMASCRSSHGRALLVLPSWDGDAGSLAASDVCSIGYDRRRARSTSWSHLGCDRRMVSSISFHGGTSIPTKWYGKWLQYDRRSSPPLKVA